MTCEVDIAKLGAQGDGVAEIDGVPLFVPFTLPGERVTVTPESDSKHAKLIDVLAPSTDRVTPVCKHFGVCGGCALQHYRADAYLAWKRDIVIQALKARGLDAEVDAVLPVPLGTRRRATFALERQGQTVLLGYHRARSHDVIEIETCPVLSPKIVAKLPGLKAMLAPLLGGKTQARVGVTETDSGLDIVVEGVRPTEKALANVAAGAERLGIARVTAGGESVTLTAPSLRFGRSDVRIPPGAFLQAAPDAEAAMTELVREGIRGAKRIADLFAGLGTFSLPLAEGAAVDAYDSSEAALAALTDAARHTQKLKPLRTVPRDLFRNPLTAKDLAPYDAVVFDPPRAGAAAQVEALAKSKAKRVVAVSCNPGTLARDLRTLVDGGYTITRVVPIDQFLFSSHVEVVAHLTR